MDFVRVGLTGGIAAGKSTVAAHVHELGACVIDYDVLARQVVDPGSDALRMIADEFGQNVLRNDGSLDRSKLAQLVFSQEAQLDARHRLDAIEHPQIYRLAEEREQAWLEQPHSACNVIVHDVPLLAEVLGEIPFKFDHIVTVEASQEVRVERMMSTRSMSREQAMDRIRHQSSQAQREEIADVVIDATQPIEHMFECVDKLVAQWKAQ